MSHKTHEVFQIQEQRGQGVTHGHGSMAANTTKVLSPAALGPARADSPPEPVYGYSVRDAPIRPRDKVMVQQTGPVSPRIEPPTSIEIKSEVGAGQGQTWQPPPMLSPWELYRKAPPNNADRYTTENQGYWPHDSYWTCYYCVDSKSYTHEDYGPQQLEGSYVVPPSYQTNFQQTYYTPIELQERSGEPAVPDTECVPAWGYQQGWSWRAPEPTTQDGQQVLHEDDKVSSLKDKLNEPKSAHAHQGRVRKASTKPRKRGGTRLSAPKPASPRAQMTTPPRSSDTSPIEGIANGKSPAGSKNKIDNKRGDTTDITSIENCGRPRFSMEEEYVMLRLREEGMSWAHIASLLPVRGSRSLQVHYSSMLARQFDDWNAEYDMRLVSLVNQHERAMWDVISERFQETNIKGISCRYRYMQLHDQQMRSIDKWVAEQRRNRRR